MNSHWNVGGADLRRLLSRTMLALACAVSLATAPAAAQTAPSADPEIRAVIDRLFDGMRQGDSTAVRAVFHPEARMLTTVARDGSVVLQEGSLDEFVRAVGTPHDEMWDERIGTVEIRLDDPLATAWVPYRFYLGETFSHCGVNAFQLMRGDDGWQVIQITDTRRRDCPE